MRKRLPIGFWLPVGALLSIALWYGCEQKGDLSPVTSGQSVLTFIDTVIVEPDVLSPSGVAVIDAIIVNESAEPAPGEDVRFTVSRGQFENGTADTTISTDNYGRARASYTAPPDTGAVTFSAELLSMSDIRSTMIPVHATGQTLGGLLNVWVDEDTLFADNGTSSTLVHARLQNEQNNPVSGATISFSTTAGLITSPATTDEAGVASATLSSTSHVGSAVIIATYNQTADTLTVTFLEPYPASSVTLSSTLMQVTAGTDSATITASVMTEAGQPVLDNTIVVFSTTRGTLSRSTAATVGGEATTILYAPTTTGGVRLTATTGTVQDDLDLSVTPGPVAVISVSSEYTTLVADNWSESEIWADAVDAYGNAAAAGTPIAFSATGGTVTDQATVNEAGRATAQFRSGLGTGPASVLATNSGVQGSVSITLTASTPSSVSISADPPLLPADGVSQATVRALVLDEGSRPVSDGTQVTLTAEVGQLSQVVPVAGHGGKSRDGSKSRHAAAFSSYERSEWTGTVKSHSFAPANQLRTYPTASVLSVTTVNGYATAILTSGTTAGTDMLTATASGASDQTTVEYEAGTAAAVVVTPQETELPADGVSGTIVSCQVVDAYGNPLGGGVAISVTSTLGQVIPTGGYTNAQGVFTTNLITSRQQGTCAIVATADQATGYNEVDFTAPEAEGIVITAEEPSILADGVSSTTIRIYVADEYGLPVPSAAVEWEAEAGLGTLIPITTTTDSTGIATATFVGGASVTDAEQTVTATVGEYSDDVTMDLRGVTIESAVSVDDLPADGVSTADVSAVVRETTSGVAVVDANVRFATNAGSVQQFAATDEAGVATATYRSGTEPGLVTITCSYGDTLRSQTSLDLTSVEAEFIDLQIAEPVLLANGVASTQVTATISNAGGQIVPNTSVIFTALDAGSFNPVTVMTDANGNATSTFRADASVTDIEANIDVAIERSSIQDEIMLRGVNLNITSAASALPANGAATSTITVHLSQTTTHIGIGGAGVLFGASLGMIPSSVATDSTGTAYITFTAGTEIGEAEIVARYGNLITDTITISMFAPAAADMDLTVSEASVIGNGSETTGLSAAIMDQLGNAVSGVTVTWSLDGAGSLGAGQSVTNGDGIATNWFRAPATTEDIISVVRVSSASAEDSVSVESRGVSVAVTSTVQALPANGVSTVGIQAQVRETTSMVGVAGAAVGFGTSLGFIPATVQTDESGVVSVNLTAGDVVGDAVIVARYGNLLTDTVTVEFYSPSPSLAQAEATSLSILADGLSSTDVTAYVFDELGVPLVGATVVWTAEGVSWTPVQTMTDFAGATTIAFGSTASTADVTATLTASAGSASAQVAIVERGITVAASATPEMVIADGSSSARIDVHVYETTSQIAVSEVGVSFGTDRGTIPNWAVTDESGVASVMLTSSTETGTAVVVASYGDQISAQTNVLFAESTPTTMSLTASPTMLLADNDSHSTLTAVLTDQNGNPVPNGTQVRFSIPPQSGSLENLRTTTNGVAQNVLTSSSTPDTVTIVAWAENHTDVRDSVVVIYTVGAPAVVTLSAQTDSLRADGIETDSLTARVTDAVGHPLANVEVTFETTIGNITSSRTTNSFGNAQVPFSSSQTGTAQITARAGDASGSYTLYLIPGAPNSIQLSYFPNSVGVRASGRNETLLITALVLDANNNPVIDGTDVFFNINNSPGGGDFLSSYDAIPTINGEATVSYNSGTVSGTARIRAICEGISAVSTEILVYAGPPFIEDIGDGCLSSHMSLGANPCNMFGMDIVGDSVRITALVGDRYNNPVTPGTAVYFTTSGGVITTATGYTDSSGFASVTLYSGNPLPTIPRWLDTLLDPNLGTPILCSGVPDQDGVAKVIAKSAGVDMNGDSVQVWATTNVIFDYSQPLLYIRDVTVNGDPNERELFIGQNALIRLALYDWNYWPMVTGTEITFSASAGNVYPNAITVPCPGDTSFTVSFFNSLTLSDDDAATPVLINVEATHGAAYAFTETFTLRASMPPGP